MQNFSFENYCKQEAIVLGVPQNSSEFISNLFQADNALCKYFQNNI